MNLIGRFLTVFLLLSYLTIGCSSVRLNAQVVEFTETFANSDANWRGPAANGSDLLVVVPSGGPNGSSFVSTDFNFEFLPDGSGMNGGQPTPALFRAQDEFGSSGGAFEGNWISSGVDCFSFSFRHDLPEPINVFARFSSPDNFPGVGAIEFAPILPGQWTEVSFEIDPDNPQFVFEGPASTFDSVFSNIGHIQLGLSVPTGLGGSTTNFDFDLDNVSITTIPEPGFGIPVLMLFAGTALRRKRRRDLRFPKVIPAQAGTLGNPAPVL